MPHLVRRIFFWRCVPSRMCYKYEIAFQHLRARTSSYTSTQIATPSPAPPTTKPPQSTQQLTNSVRMQSSKPTLKHLWETSQAERGMRILIFKQFVVTAETREKDNVKKYNNQKLELSHEDESKHPNVVPRTPPTPKELQRCCGTMPGPGFDVM